VRSRRRAQGLAPDIPPTGGATEASHAYRLLHAVLARARRDGVIKEKPRRDPGRKFGGDARAQARQHPKAPEGCKRHDGPIPSRCLGRSDDVNPQR